MGVIGVLKKVGVVAGIAVNTAAKVSPESAIAQIGSNVIDRFIPDATAKQEATAQLNAAIVNGEFAEITGQLDINKVEAASQKTFVSGWRPYIGWICGTAVGYQFLARPLLTFLVALCGSHVAAPSLDMQDLMTLLTCMLGFGAMRSFDKLNNSSNGH